MPRLLLPALLLALVPGLAGCAARNAPPAAERITDAAYLGGSMWDDGQAELAFYLVELLRDPYGREAAQQFLVGTFLVKHPFNAGAMTKARGESEASTPAFKYAVFYEIASGALKYKRHHVVNAAQADLAPLKASFSSFDWCSNIYQELAFRPDGTVDALFRSDDYGNRSEHFDYEPNAYPVAMLPLLVRGLDFSGQTERAFSVVLPNGAYVGATARLDGREPVELAEGRVEAERIVVRYKRPVPSFVGEETEASETYWRGTDAARRLLKLQGATGQYRMTLTEALRSAYWREDFWPRLGRVADHP